MRQRKSALFPSSSAGETTNTSNNNSNNHEDDDDEESGGGGSSSEEEEEMIQAAHPQDASPTKRAGVLKRFIQSTQDQDAASASTATASSNTKLTFLWKEIQNGQAGWVQLGMIILAAVLTYSYNTTTNVQLAIMTVIVLAGAVANLAAPHIVTAGIGAFVGGQNIIGSNTPRLLGMANDVGVTHYLWLLVLSLAVGLVWRKVMVPHKILDGYAGRLGTTTFVGMNLTMVTLWGPLGVVYWNRYYYGFVNAIHVAEEDAAPPRIIQTAWSWADEAELGIGYVLAVLWLGMAGGWIRIRHEQYIKQWQQQQRQSDQSSSATAAPKALNNVLFPCALALLSMLLVNATQYQHKYGLYNGFAVGSYVAMASLAKLPTTWHFGGASLLAALWGLVLTPFFVGFAGKSGFTSMLGHVSFVACQTAWRKAAERRRQREEQAQLVMEQGHYQLEPATSSRDDMSSRPTTTSAQSAQQQQQQHNEESVPLNPPSSTSTSTSSLPILQQNTKHFKPKQDTTFLTKQQRRQMQRLQHLRHASSSLQDDATTSGSGTANTKTFSEQRHEPQQQQQQSTLIHRGWQAGDGVWQHPLIDDAGGGEDTARASTGWKNMV